MTLATQLGPVGIWTFRFDQLSASDIRQSARTIESLGFPALWVPEVGVTEALSLAGLLLSSTERLIVANGIARITDRSAGAAAAGHRLLNDDSGGRHLLGLGLGGRLAGEPLPVPRMANYLDALTESWTAGLAPVLMLAAYNPRMAELAAQRTAGVHTYLVTAEHTRRIRETIGADAALAAELPIVLRTDADEARNIGATHLGRYLASGAHQRKFRALGYAPEEMDPAAPSDRLVDDVVAWGTLDTIAERVAAYHAAGADHVALQVLGTTSLAEDLAAWEALAPVFL